MADLIITATQIVPGSDAQLAYGTAGATITAGQVVYLDSTANTWKLFDANDSTLYTNVPGIALNGCSSTQALTVQTGGSLTLGAGAAPTLGLIYIASATAGGIAPSADLASGWMCVILGVGGATNTLKMRVYNSGSIKA